MMSARSSPSNSRVVLYGLGGSAQEAIGFSKYGINAIFHEPLERTAALKLVRATQPLITHEFRRYVRIPIVTEVNVVLADGRRFSATSAEISSGGMSFKTIEDLNPNQTLEVSFALLTLPRIWVKGAVTWRKPQSNLFGMRFEPGDDRRLKIKSWVESYLEMLNCFLLKLVGWRQPGFAPSGHRQVIHTRQTYAAATTVGIITGKIDRRDGWLIPTNPDRNSPTGSPTEARLASRQSPGRGQFPQSEKAGPRTRPAHRLRIGPMPQHRRMLEP